MESMAEGTIKDLVASGHALADDMTGAPSVLVRCLATQLEVQLVRANALAEDQQRAIESIKQADSAVKLAHEKFSALAAENAALKESERAFDEMCAEEYGDNWVSELTETPATDAFLAEVRAQGVDAAIDAAKNLVAQEYEYKDFKAAQSDCCMFPGSDLVGKVEMTEWLVDFAAELRKGGNQ
ncbi:TPA: eae-like domain protein [Escherichia coli]